MVPCEFLLSFEYDLHTDVLFVLGWNKQNEIINRSTSHEYSNREKLRKKNNEDTYLKAVSRRCCTIGEQWVMSTRKSDTDTHAKSKNRGKERIEIQRNLSSFYLFLSNYINSRFKKYEPVRLRLVGKLGQNQFWLSCMLDRKSPNVRSEHWIYCSWNYAQQCMWHFNMVCDVSILYTIKWGNVCWLSWHA